MTSPKLLVTTIAVSLSLLSCSPRSGNTDTSSKQNSILQDELSKITEGKPGQFGVAIIIDNTDTITFNNSADYPLMSMFKLHEAIAVCHTLDTQTTELDSTLTIKRSDLDPETWSPMFKEHTQDHITMSIGELLAYTLIHSDNNTSNLLFDRVVSTTDTDCYIRTILPEDDFQIRYTESEMKADHSKAYENRSSPLSYAALVNRVFTDSLVSRPKQEYIKQMMYDCHTGASRIAAGLPEGVKFAHRTGSGYTNSRGEVSAVNDSGYVTLPSGRHYSIAVFVKNFGGTQEDAEKITAEISKTVYNFVAN